MTVAGAECEDERDDNQRNSVQARAQEAMGLPSRPGRRMMQFDGVFVKSARRASSKSASDLT